MPNLPPITHIAAGQQHILLSDGERVWQIGRGYDASGTVGEWHGGRPRLRRTSPMLRFPCQPFHAPAYRMLTPPCSIAAPSLIRIARPRTNTVSCTNCLLPSAAVSTAPWRRPALVLTLPAGGCVRQLTAGMHSSGVVSDAGAAWAWGRILDRHHADSVVRRHPHLAFGEGGGHVAPSAATGHGSGGGGGVFDGLGRHGAGAGAWAGAGAGGGMARHSAPPQLHEDVRWSWSGFGGREPARLDGLGGPVRALALGGWHALALVE